MSKILVIEDEASLREDIADILGLEGYHVQTAPDGSEGVKIAQVELPDLIICDVAMPEMDGYQVLLNLRSNPETVGTPFIFLTARADRNFMRHGMELGADDYLTKPFTHAELFAAIRSRLKRQDELVEVGERELETAKKRLGRVIAHELRTPMTSISMAQYMITQQIDQLSKEDIHELLDIFVAGSRRLSHLTEQMVLMTHLETGLLNQDIVQKHGSPSELWPVLISAINLARDFAYQRRDGEVLLDEQSHDAVVQCHAPSLTHAFAELISNGLDFSPEGSPVQITQWLEGNSIRVRISDRGRGIPPEQIENALKPFRQINRDLYEQQGLGLGLSLAKQIIEMHGGSLEVKSQPEQGTQVYASFPCL
jgi:signal transduction histidine kinase